MTEEDLLNLRDHISASKERVAELTGEERALLKRLKDNYGCTTLETANKKHKTMTTEIDKLDVAIDKATKTLEDRYPDLDY